MHLGLVGYGNIGRTLTGLLERAPVARITVLVRAAYREAVAGELKDSPAAGRIEVTGEVGALVAARPDVVVECAGQGALAEFGPVILQAGIPVIAASVGALANEVVEARLRAAAEAGKTQLVLPAGAIGGVDLLSALAAAGGLSVSYRGTKPPAAWKGTPAETVLDLDAIDAPQVFFSGTAREAACTYPRNANVAATLALAGPGFEATRVELIAYPGAAGNAHAYTVVSPLGSFSIDIANAASGGNAKTSVATVYSLLREIGRFRNAVVI